MNHGALGVLLIGVALIVAAMFDGISTDKIATATLVLVVALAASVVVRR